MARLIGNEFLELNMVSVDENAITEAKFKSLIRVDDIQSITPAIDKSVINGIQVGKKHPDIRCFVRVYVEESLQPIFCEDTYEDIIFELKKIEYV